MGAFRNIFFLAAIFSTFFIVEKIKHSGKNQIQIEMAHQTLYNLLESSKEDISKHYFKNAQHHIGKAIEYLKHIERSFDKSTNSVIDAAIAGLEQILTDIDNKVIYEDDLNESFAKAMNALALAHLVVCEAEIEKNDMDAAITALKHTINHLNHAMKYSSGHLIEVEEELISNLADLSASGDITKETIQKDVELIRSTIIVARPN